MELVKITENLSEILKQLVLLQDYNSYKLGEDWASDFARFCKIRSSSQVDHYQKILTSNKPKAHSSKNMVKKDISTPATVIRAAKRPRLTTPLETNEQAGRQSEINAGDNQMANVGQNSVEESTEAYNYMEISIKSEKDLLEDIDANEQEEEYYADAELLDGADPARLMLQTISDRPYSEAEGEDESRSGTGNAGVSDSAFPCRRGRRFHPIWEKFITLRGNNGKVLSNKCKLCTMTVSAQPQRMLHHVENCQKRSMSMHSSYHLPFQSIPTIPVLPIQAEPDANSTL